MAKVERTLLVAATDTPTDESAGSGVSSNSKRLSRMGTAIPRWTNAGLQ